MLGFDPIAGSALGGIGADSSVWATIATVDAAVATYSDLAVIGGIQYDYRILATTATGPTISNIATATAVAGGGGGPLARMYRFALVGSNPLAWSP